MCAGEILAHEIAAFLLLENFKLNAIFSQIFSFKSWQKFSFVILTNLIIRVSLNFFKGITWKSIYFLKDITKKKTLWSQGNQFISFKSRGWLNRSKSHELDFTFFSLILTLQKEKSFANFSSLFFVITLQTIFMLFFKG
mgnify:CR=1 FL=1